MESETSEKGEKGVAVVEKEERNSGLNYNEILTHIGQFGKWQQQIFFWYLMNPSVVNIRAELQ